MRVDLPLHLLDPSDVRHLGDLFRRQEVVGPSGLQRVMAELADACRVELAKRRIEEAGHRDPLGHFWLGNV